jgi:hypothetical protein
VSEERLCEYYSAVSTHLSGDLGGKGVKRIQGTQRGLSPPEEQKGGQCQAWLRQTVCFRGDANTLTAPSPATINGEAGYWCMSSLEHQVISRYEEDLLCTEIVRLNYLL